MQSDTEHRRERAYRFDLMIATDWCERFDAVLAEHVKMPKKGRLLEINCGTGSAAIALAATLDEGEVVGTDEDPDRIAIAQSKAGVASTSNTFLVANPEQLDFENDAFDGVILDASLVDPDRLGAMAAEAVRVARDGAPIAVKVALRGTFDEFYSLYWEALHDIGLDDAVWASLEGLMSRRPTVHEALDTIRASGIKSAFPHRSREEWRFATAREFLTAPLVSDLFLAEWVGILPEDRQADVMRTVASIIDREIDGHYFDVSASAVVFAGHK